MRQGGQIQEKGPRFLLFVEPFGHITPVRMVACRLLLVACRIVFKFFLNDSSIA